MTVSSAELMRAERDAANAAKDGAYAERNEVVALLARMALALGWRAGVGHHEDRPGETWDPAWRTVVFIDLPAGQVSWHLWDGEWRLIDDLPTYDAPWDGHNKNEKYRRVNAALPWNAPEKFKAFYGSREPLRWLHCKPHNRRCCPDCRPEATPSTARHTPGPWHVVRRRDGLAIAPAGALLFGSEKEADAQLIAAAPALADALERLTEAFLLLLRKDTEDRGAALADDAIEEGRAALRAAGRTR